MKLTSKIILSQLMVSLFVIILGIMLMPEVIYRNFKGTVRSNVSSYSSQIMSNISQKLVEIKRETNVLTADDDLKQKLQEALHDPSDSRNAAISLYLSGFYIRDGIVRTRTNHHGGILGGITSGMPVMACIAFKPTPSIAIPQKTVDYVRMEETVMQVKGRHDPCVAVRAVPVVEAVTAIVITDLLLEEGK